MADHVKDTVELLRRAPLMLADVLRREVPKGGLSWALRLVLSLEETAALEETPALRAGGDLPIWQQALLVIDSLEKRGAPIAALTDAQLIDRFAQAVALWLGFKGGHPPLTQLEDWMNDFTSRSAPIGLFLVPSLTDPDERDLCLQLIGERCGSPSIIAFSRRWFESHGAPLLPSIAARMREATQPVVAEKWARTLAAASPRHPEAMDELLSDAISGETRTNLLARDVARTAPEDALAALQRRQPDKKKKKMQAVADTLAEDCRLLIGARACAEDAEKQAFLEGALSADFPAPSGSRAVAPLLPRGPLFAALRAVRHPATQLRAEAANFAAGYAKVAPTPEDPRVIELELLALDWHARSEESRQEANQWFAHLVKKRKIRETAPFEELLAAAQGEPSWEERISAVLDEAEAEIEALAEKKRALKEEREARREEAREAARAHFAPEAEKLLQERRSWIGELILSSDKTDMLTLDLRRLYRFGWRRQECEYAHKLVRDLVRKIDGQEASLSLYDDIYWDEIPKPGARIETIRLPRPFGSRTPQMDRIVGEIGAARVLPKP